MTLATTTNRVQYTGNGVTTVFSFPYRFLLDADIKVYKRLIASPYTETLQVITTDYTLSGAGGASGGNVTMVTAPSSSYYLVIVRDPSPTQSADYTANDAFPSSSHENALDRQALGLQAVRDILRRVLLQPIGSQSLDLEMPEPFLALAGQVLGVNALGTGYGLYAPTDLSLSTVSSFANTLLDDANAAAFMTTLGFGAFFQTLISSATVLAFMTALGVKFGSITVDFGNVSDNTTIAAPGDTTVTGAVVGDWVLMSASGTLETTLGARVYGKIVSANTLRPYFANDTAGALDAASQTLYYLIIPKSLVGL